VICINSSKGENPVLLLPATLAQKMMSYLALKELVKAAKGVALKQNTVLPREQGPHHLLYKPLPCFPTTVVATSLKNQTHEAPPTLLEQEKVSIA